MRFAKAGKSTHLKCCACHAKWRWKSPKCCACYEDCNSFAETLAKVLRVPQRTILTIVVDTWKCQEARPLPRKTTWQPALTPSQRKGFAASSIDTATAEEIQRSKTRHVGASKRAFRARPPQILTLYSIYYIASKSTSFEPQNLQPQDRQVRPAGQAGYPHFTGSFIGHSPRETLRAPADIKVLHLVGCHTHIHTKSWVQPCE